MDEGGREGKREVGRRGPVRRQRAGEKVVVAIRVSGVPQHSANGSVICWPTAHLSQLQVRLRVGE